MCNLRANLSEFIKTSADIGWVHEMLELPSKEQNDEYFIDANGMIVNVRVQPEKYANVKGQPAKDASELEKWGDSSDLILLCKMLKRNIICVAPENGVDKATIYHPDAQSVQVCFLESK